MRRRQFTAKFRLFESLIGGAKKDKGPIPRGEQDGTLEMERSGARQGRVVIRG